MIKLLNNFFLKLEGNNWSCEELSLQFLKVGQFQNVWNWETKNLIYLGFKIDLKPEKIFPGTKLV